MAIRLAGGSKRANLDFSVYYLGIMYWFFRVLLGKIIGYDRVLSSLVHYYLLLMGIIAGITLY